MKALLVKSILAVSVASAAMNTHAGRVSYFDSSWTKFDSKFSTINANSGLSGGGEVNNTANPNSNDGNYIRKGQKKFTYATANGLTNHTHPTGNAYDAEYLFYKFDKNTKKLSVGIQTGFNVATTGSHSFNYVGDYNVKNQGYYSTFNRENRTTTNYTGDMKLSFGNGKSYALDFGLASKTQKTVINSRKNCNNYGGINCSSAYKPYYNKKGGKAISGAGDAGVYQVAADGWETFKGGQNGLSKDVEWASKANKRTKKADVTQEKGKEGDSYFRVATFNVEDILGTGFDFSKGFSLSAAWTMSCYNDAISGITKPIKIYHPPTPVSEPASIALFGLGLVGLGLARRRNKATAAA